MVDAFATIPTEECYVSGCVWLTDVCVSVLQERVREREGEEGESPQDHHHHLLQLTPFLVEVRGFSN